MPIYFQFYALEKDGERAEVHHFVKAESPEDGTAKVKQTYPEDISVKFISGTTATIQNEKGYTKLIK